MPLVFFVCTRVCICRMDVLLERRKQETNVARQTLVREIMKSKTPIVREFFILYRDYRLMQRQMDAKTKQTNAFRGVAGVKQSPWLGVLYMTHRRGKPQSMPLRMLPCPFFNHLSGRGCISPPNKCFFDTHKCVWCCAKSHGLHACVKYTLFRDAIQRETGTDMHTFFQYVESYHE